MNSDTITDPLIDEKYHPIMPISLGLTVTGNSGGGRVTELLTTSDTAYSKLAGYGMTDVEREDGDIDGPFALAVSIETAGEGQIVWFTSSYFLEDAYNAASSGANSNLGMNALASLLKALMIGVFPLAYLGVGAWIVLKRRRLQNEPV